MAAADSENNHHDVNSGTVAIMMLVRWKSVTVAVLKPERPPGPIMMQERELKTEDPSLEQKRAKTIERGREGGKEGRREGEERWR